MRTLLWTVVVFFAALVGIKYYDRAKKAGKSVKEKVKEDWNKVADKALSSLEKIKKVTVVKKKEKDFPADKNACPTCGCQNVPIGTNCPNCKTLRA